MRKSFDSLCGLLKQQLGRDPLSGDIEGPLLVEASVTTGHHWEDVGVEVVFAGGIRPSRAIMERTTTSDALPL